MSEPPFSFFTRLAAVKSRVVGPGLLPDYWIFTTCSILLSQEFLFYIPSYSTHFSLIMFASLLARFYVIYTWLHSMTSPYQKLQAILPFGRLVMYSFRLGGDSSAVCHPSPFSCINFPELPHILIKDTDRQSKHRYLIFKNTSRATVFLFTDLTVRDSTGPSFTQNINCSANLGAFSSFWIWRSHIYHRSTYV